ncbi:MAG: outer membrane protein assembly factor BamD [Betaproteobacteria bacterium]|nr:outer membrane protein assembly factor BamD [Betaproteobacteria bacterium]
MKRSLAIFLLPLLLSGCFFLADPVDETASWSATKLYTEAKDELTGGGYQKAISYYEKLESRYPYGRYAQQAQIEIAYAYFKDGDITSAIAAADRFIKLHPNHPNVDYAYYLKGLVNFAGDLGIIGAYVDQDPSERDPKAARESFDSFKELVNRYPESKYAPDALARMKYLVNALAGHEVHVARYYMKRGAHIAAVNRAQYALNQYPQTPALEEALFILAKAYDLLGMNDLRDDADRVMRKNFPDSAYLKGDGKSGAWWQFWKS